MVRYNATKGGHGNVLTFCVATFLDIIWKHTSAGTDGIGVAFFGLLYTVSVCCTTLMPSERLRRFINPTRLGRSIFRIIANIIPLCWVLFAYTHLFIVGSNSPASRLLVEGLFGAFMTILVGVLAVLATHELGQRQRAYRKGLEGLPI